MGSCRFDMLLQSSWAYFSHDFWAHSCGISGISTFLFETFIQLPINCPSGGSDMSRFSANQPKSVFKNVLRFPSFYTCQWNCFTMKRDVNKTYGFLSFSRRDVHGRNPAHCLEEWQGAVLFFIALESEAEELRREEYMAFFEKMLS